jgi:hypothetical protein
VRVRASDETVAGRMVIVILAGLVDGRAGLVKVWLMLECLVTKWRRCYLDV